MLIIEYQDNWPEKFKRIKNELTRVLSFEDLAIEHIGSTSVIGLAAKPIIDLDIVYYKTEQFKVIVEKLKSIGYLHNGNQGVPGREVFKRNPDYDNHPVLDSIQHHLYACHSSSIELKRHLTFRNTLRSNKDARDAYGLLKHEIANQANQDKTKYASLKENLAREFIESILN